MTKRYERIGLISWLMFYVNLILVSAIHAQNSPQQQTNIQALLQLSQQLDRQQRQAKVAAAALATQQGWPLHVKLAQGAVIEIQSLRPDGSPVYYLAHNLNAAKTVSADKLWPGGLSGFNLSGLGINLGIWDAGMARSTHRELNGRVTQRDGATSVDDHTTHVSGTMIAQGIDPTAQGMSFEASLDAYDFNNDEAEMAAAAAQGLKASNHSYGFINGWLFDFFDDGLWVWFGTPAINSREDYRFGFYSKDSQLWDQIAFNAPFYLIVKAAGNDRSDGGPAPGALHWVFQGNTRFSSTDPRDPDGGNTGYDTIDELGIAKNILTVGAVQDIPNGYTNSADVVMSSFSSWGPADDGRIKPDIVANGIGLRSSIANSNSSYASFSGTSMSTPNATGTLGLLMQHYQRTHAGAFMRSATLKALVIHTADEAGSAAGPDYSFGWGLLNAATAASVIAADTAGKAVIDEKSLANGRIDTFSVTSDGASSLRVTIAWTDPPGTPASNSLDPPTKMLVNDLDLRVTNGGATFMPWILSASNPDGPAATGDNISDNVEQVLIPSPSPGRYTVTVSHKRTVNGGSQDFGLILTGIKIGGGGGGGVIKASAANCQNNLPQNCTVTITINIDMTGTAPAQLLGSFAANLSWDPSIVSFVSNSGMFTGFSGFINTSNILAGQLFFSGTNPNGAGGMIKIIELTFKVQGPLGAQNFFDLDFTAMSAATTQTNLLSLLTVTDCNSTVTSSGRLGDVNGDGLVNSTDGLIILSYDASMPINSALLSRINQGFGDVDANRATNSTDALILLSFDVSISVPFPVGQAFCP